MAEAAKVIENTQRDVNIALINELALLFNRLGIDTEEVLLAAGSKWNFLPFRPGLVGGHCIGVDPYYLTHKAQEIGFHPEMILAGRRLNDSMANYVAGQVVKLMAGKKILAKGSKVLVLGLTFKENCPDLRNSKVADVVRELKNYGAKVDVYDPWIDRDEAEHEYGIRPDQARARWRVRCGGAGGGAQAVPRAWASPACARPARRITWCMTSSTCSAPTRSMAGCKEHCVKILLTGAAGFIGSHVRAEAAGAWRRGRRARQSQRLLRPEPQARAPRHPRARSRSSAS